MRRMAIDVAVGGPPFQSVKAGGGEMLAGEEPIDVGERAAGDERDRAA
jgi:hypothetical protein